MADTEEGAISSSHLIAPGSQADTEERASSSPLLIDHSDHSITEDQSASSTSELTQTPSDREGDVLFNSAPPMINLATSGLRRSNRIQQQQERSGPSIVAYTSTSKNERPFK